jgi:hypothetical protein
MSFSLGELEPERATTPEEEEEEEEGICLAFGPMGSFIEATREDDVL